MSQFQKEGELDQGVVVTQAMIEAGVSQLDIWLERWLTEMTKDGHTGFEKSALIERILCPSISESQRR